jgi:uncharacterized protein with PIN domain
MSAKFDLKKQLFQINKHCSRCECKLVLLDNKNQKAVSHFAVLDNDNTLICYRCKRIESKKKELANMPLLYRINKKINSFIPIRQWRLRFGHFIYRNTKQGWLTKKLN